LIELLPPVIRPDARPCAELRQELFSMTIIAADKK
jgi:hypothetical protein